MSSTSFVPFPSSQIAGAVIVNVFAIACTLGLVSIALRVTWVALRHIFTRNTAIPQEYVFFHTQLGNYAACLLIAMTFNSLAGMIGLPWLLLKGIREGSTCRAQATIMQIGNWASAYFTVTIAVHTFNSLVLKKRQPAVVCRTTVVTGWTLAVVTAAIPFMLTQPEGFIYGEDGFACGIRDVYPKHQFFLHLLPIFVASFLSALLYSLIFLVLRGTLNIRCGIKLTLDPNERLTSTESENYRRFVARIAQSMIWYPIAYVAFLVPYSVTRLLEISGFAVPSQATIFGSICWFTLGVADVALLYNTFRVLGPAFNALSGSSTCKDLETVASFGSPVIDKGRFIWDQESPLEEKITQYRSPVPIHQSSSDSIQRLLPVHRERNASAQIFHSYPSSPSIGRPITSASDRHRMIAHPEEAMLRPLTIRNLTDPVRQDSTLSLGLPLPVAPQPITTEQGLFGDDSPMTVQLSTQTFGATRLPNLQHAKSTSSPSQELEASRLLDSPPISGKPLSRDVYKKPMLRAVALSPPALPNRSVPRRLTLRASRSFQVLRPSMMIQAMSNVSPTAVRRQRASRGNSLTFLNPRMPPNPPRAHRP